MSGQSFLACVRVCAVLWVVLSAAHAQGAPFSVQTKLTASDAAAYDQFGFSVAVSGTGIVGAHMDDDGGSASGSAYVFGSAVIPLPTTAWLGLTVLAASAARVALRRLAVRAE